MRSEDFFKRLVIRLKKPICKCLKDNLAWFIEPKENNGIRLVVHCRTCGEYIEVDKEKLKAVISLEEPYPNGPVKIVERMPQIRIDGDEDMVM